MVVHTNQVLKRLAAESPNAVWASRALAKYLIADFDILGYVFSSDLAEGQDPADEHDRTDDLLLVTPGTLTFYRMVTKGLRMDSQVAQIESQRLEKSVVPLSHVANVQMVWESTQPFAGDAPDHDPKLHLTIQLDADIPPLGREVTLPLRPEEVDGDGWVRHQIEIFAEALLLEIHDELQPVIPLEAVPEDLDPRASGQGLSS